MQKHRYSSLKLVLKPIQERHNSSSIFETQQSPIFVYLFICSCCQCSIVVELVLYFHIKLVWLPFSTASKSLTKAVSFWPAIRIWGHIIKLSSLCLDFLPFFPFQTSTIGTLHSFAQ